MTLSPQHLCRGPEQWSHLFFLRTSASSAAGWVWHQKLRQSFNINLSIPFDLTAHRHTHLHTLTQLHPNTTCTWAPFPPKPATRVLSTNIALLSGAPISPSAHTHENQGSRTPASHSSAITEWIDCVCVKCERRLCGFNSLRLAYKFKSHHCLWCGRKRQEKVCSCLGEGDLVRAKEWWQMGNTKKKD